MSKFSLKDLFSSGTAVLVEKIGDALDKNITSKEEKETLKKEIVKTIQDYELELQKLEVEDRGSARDMQKAALAQADNKSKRFIYNFAWFWSISSISYFTATTFFAVKNERVADTILGFLLGTAVAAIINFFFGSSSGSSDKSDMIKELLNKK